MGKLFLFFLLINFSYVSAQYDTTNATKMILDNGNALVHAREFSKAVFYFTEKINSIDGNNDLKLECYFYRAGAKFLLNDFRGCIADCSMGINMQYIKERHIDKLYLPEFINLIKGECYMVKGDAEQELNDLNSACTDWSMAGELGKERLKENCEKVGLTKEGSVYYITVKIGSTKRRFILDSGASEVNISEELERELILGGIITKSDYLPKGRYKTANGTMQECRRVMLKTITLGPHTISNVTASISNDDSPILLGKSFLDRFKKWSIDNEKSELFLEK